LGLFEKNFQINKGKFFLLQIGQCGNHLSCFQKKSTYFSDKMHQESFWLFSDKNKKLKNRFRCILSLVLLTGDGGNYFMKDRSQIIRNAVPLNFGLAVRVFVGALYSAQLTASSKV
jgi:hypothetical protein